MTLGQLAPGSPPTGFSDPSGSWDAAQPTVTSGNTYVVPGNGTITSWSHNAAAPAGQELTFKAFRPVTGLRYAVVGHDGPRPLTGGALNTFPSSIPVKPGDVIGLFWNLATPAKAAIFIVPGEPFLYRDGNLLDGESGDFNNSPGRRLNVTAVFVPSNAFGLGDVKRNKKRGTATLTVDIPNPGELTGSGKGVKVANAAVSSRTVSAPGPVTSDDQGHRKEEAEAERNGQGQGQAQDHLHANGRRSGYASHRT